jgi:hypothetical protein
MKNLSGASGRRIPEPHRPVLSRRENLVCIIGHEARCEHSPNVTDKLGYKPMLVKIPQSRGRLLVPGRERDQSFAIG